MFFFYFNKLGWAGSILISIIATLLIFLLVHTLAILRLWGLMHGNF